MPRGLLPPMLLLMQLLLMQLLLMQLLRQADQMPDGSGEPAPFLARGQKARASSLHARRTPEGCGVAPSPEAQRRPQEPITLAAQEWETETSLSPAAEGMAVTRWEHPDQEKKRHRHRAGTAERF